MDATSHCLPQVSITAEGLGGTGRNVSDARDGGNVDATRRRYATGAKVRPRTKRG